MFYASDIRFVYRSNQFSHRYSHRKLSPHQLHIRQQNIDFIQLIAHNSHNFHVLTIVIKWLRVAHQNDTREVFAITLCLFFFPVQALVYLTFCKEQQSYRLPGDTKSVEDLSFTTPSLARLDCKKNQNQTFGDFILERKYPERSSKIHTLSRVFLSK